MLFVNTIAYISTARQLGVLGEEQVRSKVQAMKDTQELVYRIKAGKDFQERKRKGKGQNHEFSF